MSFVHEKSFLIHKRIRSENTSNSDLIPIYSFSPDCETQQQIRIQSKQVGISNTLNRPIQSREDEVKPPIMNLTGFYRTQDAHQFISLQNGPAVYRTTIFHLQNKFRSVNKWKTQNRVLVYNLNTLDWIWIQLSSFFQLKSQHQIIPKLYNVSI